MTGGSRAMRLGSLGAVGAVGGLTVLGAALRFATLDARGLWLDEAVTVLILRKDLAGMLRAIPSSEATPPLYYVVAWGWAKLFGTGEAGVRSLPALAGTLTVPVAYLAARELVSRRAGTICAALVAVSPVLVWYSQEARAYAFMVLFGALALFFFARALSDRWDRGHVLLAWALASALAIASHYFAILPCAAQAAWLLGSVRPRRALALPFGCVLAASALLAPLALVQRSDGRVGWIEELDLAGRALDIPRDFIAGAEASAIPVALALLLASIAVVLLVVAAGPAERRGALVAGTVGGVTLALPFGLALAGADYFLGRNVLSALVPLLVVLAAGLAARKARPAGSFVTVALCALSVLLVISVAHRPKKLDGLEDWRAAAEALGPAGKARAVVLTPRVKGLNPLEVYLGGREMKESRTRVAEVAVIGMVRPERPGGLAPPLVPRPRSAPPVPAPGFRLLDRRDGPGFTILRFRAGKPRRVGRARLEAMRIDSEPPGVLLQPPLRR